MKEEIKGADLQRIYNYGKIFTVLLMITTITCVPLAIFLNYYGLIITAILFIITFFFALKVEKFKKEIDVQTYKEIVAFMEGKRLDEIEKHQEYGKRPYQKIFMMLGSALVTFFICILMVWLLKSFL